MTNTQLMSRCNDLIKTFLPDIKKECKHLINSGAIEYGMEDVRTYRMAKNVLVVAMENVARGITEFSAEDKEIRENLRKF